MQPALKLEGISKNYGKEEVLKNLNLEVFENEIFSIIGLNGCGKTTMFKVILGLCDRSSGEIEVFGIKNPINNIKEEVFYLPEKFIPNKNLRVSEFLSMFIKGYNKSYRDNLFTQYAAKVEFEKEYWDYKLGHLSKGNLQKVGLIAAFASTAKMLLLDEPLSGLDFKTRGLLLKLIKEEKQRGRTIIFTSHVLSEITNVCDRVGIFHEKNFIKILKPEEMEDEVIRIFP